MTLPEPCPALPAPVVARQTSLGGLAPSVRAAFASLGAYRLRAILTGVSIVIGVAALLLTGEVGQVAQDYVRTQWAHTGANLVAVNFRPTPGVSKAEAMAHSGLTLADVRALQALPHVVVVSPASYDGLPLIAGAITSGGWPVEAGFPSLQTIQNLTLAQGAFFSAADEASGAAVAVIGPEVASHFYPGGDPVGRELRIGAVNFRVVGVVSTAGGVPGDDYGDLTYLPFSTYQQRLAGHPPQQIFVQADQGSNVAGVLLAGERALARTHRAGLGGQPDFALSIYSAAADPEAQQLALVGSAMRIGAAVALLAGGFGVAGTMLLAVRQRRREIGIRLAVGAAPADVRRQFLIEAAVLALAGGLLGVLAGSAAIAAFFVRFRGALLGHHFRQAVQAHPVASPGALALALALCAAIGLLFGWLPARRAAGLDPIQALRQS